MLTLCRASAGTGKTYTLAAYFLALLLHGVNYRNILAVTFTNKATDEMKQRILTYLYNLAVSPTSPKSTSFLRSVRAQAERLHLSLPADKDIPALSLRLYREILADMDNMHITTIDSFLQTLLQGMTQALGYAAGYSVDLDLDHAIRVATEEILSTHIMDQEGLLKAVTNYIRSRINNEKNWDIQPALRDIAKEMFKENVQHAGDTLVTDEQLLQAYQSVLESKLVRAKTNLSTYLESFHPDINFKGRSKPSAIIDRIQRSLNDQTASNDIPFYPLTESLEKLFASQDSFSEVYKGADPIGEYRAWQQLLDLCNQARLAYNTYHLATAHFSDLMLMHYIQEQIRRDMRDNNAVLLSETAGILSRAINPGDADFILEKAGIRYHYIILDEFQDTSTLQWSNFLPLIEEVIGSGHATFIVGDAKQSIYRWRNGDWNIINNLDSPDQPWREQISLLSLQRNFRSRREVVSFTLDTFHRLLPLETDPELLAIYQALSPDNEYDLNQYYNPDNNGGFVSLRLYPYVQTTKLKLPKPEEEPFVRDKVIDHLLSDMFTRMDQLIEMGYRSSDMLILIRFKKELPVIVSWFQAHRAAFPHLAQHKIISSDSYTLDSSSAVNCLISALRYIANHDVVARHYLSLLLPDVNLSELDTLNAEMPLYELVRAIMHIILCPTGEYTGPDTAYLNGFMDRLRDFIANYSSDLPQFLAYWDDHLHSSAISSPNTDDIAVMTIHTSKGLEAKNIFIPFCTWTLSDHKGNIWCQAPGLHLPGKADSILPIANKQQAEYSMFSQDYTNEQKKQRIDNINLLYVALTRAGNNLFISVPNPVSDNLSSCNNVGQLLLSLWEMNDYSMPSSPDTPYREKTWGDIRFYPSSNSDDFIQPFIFHPDANHILTSSFHSTDEHIRFRQSQESRDYTLYGADQGQAHIDQRAFGTICHDILSLIERKEDTPAVIGRFFRRGIIPDPETRTEIENLFQHMWDKPEMASWFDGSWKVLREETIFVPTREATIAERRMDRVMIRGNQAIVLDYKFGLTDDDKVRNKYHAQVREYMSILSNLGYQPQGYLYFAQTAELIQVTNH